MIRSKNIDLDKAFADKSVKFLAPSVNPKTATVTGHDTSVTLAAVDFNWIATNTGAWAGIVLTLPAASTVTSRSLKVAVLVAQTVTLTPATGEKIYLNGSGVASKYLLIAWTIGNFCEIYSDGTDYIVTNYSWVVTKEA